MTLARSPMRRRYRDTGPDEKTRQRLAERSGGWCELKLPGCTGRATEVSHRKGRKSGGRHRGALDENNQLCNIMAACHTCGQWVTARPAEANDLVLVLKECQIPELEPASYRSECWALLGAEVTPL